MRDKLFSITPYLKGIGLVALLVIGQACSQTQGGAGNSDTLQVSTSSPVAAGAQRREALAPGTASVMIAQGQIVSVDEKNQLVTLQPVRGKQLLLHVLDQQNVITTTQGERVIARFYEIASIQSMGSGQTPSAQSLTAGIVNAAAEQTQADRFGSQYQFAVTIDAIDRDNKTISIKGLDGAVEVVAVANPQSLEQVRVGEQITVTLIDLVAIALEKEGGSVKSL